MLSLLLIIGAVKYIIDTGIEGLHRMSVTASDSSDHEYELASDCTDCESDFDIYFDN